MPDPAVPAEFLAEAMQNGLLRGIGDSFEFMHPSVQDCFAAMSLLALPVPAVLSEVPAARWSRREDDAINESEYARRATSS